MSFTRFLIYFLMPKANIDCYGEYRDRVPLKPLLRKLLARDLRSQTRAAQRYFDPRKPSTLALPGILGCLFTSDQLYQATESLTNLAYRSQAKLAPGQSEETRKYWSQAHIASRWSWPYCEPCH